jgi:hypothetical protein
MKRSLVAPLLVLSLTVAVVGCAKKPPKLVPVSGKLVYHGQPLANTMIQFNPVELDQNSVLANATTDQNGSFKLRSYPHGDGAKPGRYKVFITPYPGSPPVPSKYTAPEETSLEATIPEEGKDNLVLTLKD